MVTEPREFPSWNDSSGTGVTIDDGIMAGKRALNDLHHQLGKDGYNQVLLSVCLSVCLSV